MTVLSVLWTNISHASYLATKESWSLFRGSMTQLVYLAVVFVKKNV